MHAMNLPTLADEEELLIKLKAGNYDAFTAIYHGYSLRILGRLIRLLKSEALAEEILQDLFLKIWEKRADIDLTRSFRSYLFTIAQNLVYDHFRRVALDEKFRFLFLQEHTEGYKHIEEEVSFKQAQEQLMQAIAKLPPQCQRVFILFKIEGKSYAEIGDLLQISKSTINNHLTKANLIMKSQIPFYQQPHTMFALFFLTYFS